MAGTSVDRTSSLGNCRINLIFEVRFFRFFAMTVETTKTLTSVSDYLAEYKTAKISKLVSPIDTKIMATNLKLKILEGIRKRVFINQNNHPRVRGL